MRTVLRVAGKNTHEGMTLVELLIVVSIMGILLAISIPAYSKYIVRSQIAEGLQITSNIRLELQEFYLQTGRIPSQTELTIFPGLPIQGKYVGSVTIRPNDATIIVTFSSTKPNLASGNINGLSLFISPIPNSDVTIVHWVCTSNINQSYLPSGCKSLSSTKS